MRSNKFKVRKFGRNFGFQEIGNVPLQDKRMRDGCIYFVVLKYHQMRARGILADFKRRRVGGKINQSGINAAII